MPIISKIYARACDVTRRRVGVESWNGGQSSESEDHICFNLYSSSVLCIMNANVCRQTECATITTVIGLGLIVVVVVVVVAAAAAAAAAVVVVVVVVVVVSFTSHLSVYFVLFVIRFFVHSSVHLFRSFFIH